LKNWIKNIEGQSTSSEEAPEYFGAKGALSLKNENIMCDICILKNCNQNFFHRLSTFVINKEYNYTKQHPQKDPYWIEGINETSGKHQIKVK
jgi:hypothetical protein